MLSFDLKCHSSHALNLIPRGFRLKDYLSSILGDPDALSREHAIFSGDVIFSGESLLLDGKLSLANIPSSKNIASTNCPWVSEEDLSATGSNREQRESPLSRLYERMISSFLLKFKMADGEYRVVIFRVPSCNECVKNCCTCLHKGCIFSLFFKVRLGRSIYCFRIQFQVPLRKRAGKYSQILT